MSGGIAILGCGAWGTALAHTLAVSGQRVRLWGRKPATIDVLRETHRNSRYLPDAPISSAIEPTCDLEHALDGADCVLAAVPAQTVRAMLASASPYIPKGAALVLCAKGIERSTGRLLSSIAAELLPDNTVAALSGPSFAADVVRGLPTAVVVAANDHRLASELAARFSSATFRCYSSDDLTGVEVGGALKNVLAIAAGGVSGAGLGASAQAAMVTRGFVELRRVGSAFGARPETLMGLSGLGDLVLTCSSAQSRNFAYGVALGRGETLEGRPLAEGVATAGIAARIARERAIEAPIIEAVDRLLSGDLTIAEAVRALMTRPLKTETE